MWCLSMKWTSFPLLNRPIDGEEGGYGSMYFLACAVASASTPAKTVVSREGFISEDKAILTAGLALPAAQPQTELTITRTVPDSGLSALSTSWAVFNSSKPTAVSSSFMGATNSGGYILLDLG